MRDGRNHRRISNIALRPGTARFPTSLPGRLPRLHRLQLSAMPLLSRPNPDPLDLIAAIRFRHGRSKFAARRVPDSHLAVRQAGLLLPA
jgi:hypothetical protein